MTCLTLRALTAYSRHVMQLRSLCVARLPTLRCTKTSPGARPKMVLACKAAASSLLIVFTYAQYNDEPVTPDRQGPSFKVNVRPHEALQHDRHASFQMPAAQRKVRLAGRKPHRHSRVRTPNPEVLWGLLVCQAAEVVWLFLFLPCRPLPVATVVGA